MSLPDEILDLENRSLGAHGEPTLGRALLLAIGEWMSGNRDRELRLHLLFLTWYCSLEPDWLTGFEESATAGVGLAALFAEVYETFADQIQEDAECLFVVGLIAQLTPWLLGETEAIWETRAKDFRERYRILLPAGLSPSHFEGRGAYGEYFAGQARVSGGF